MLKQQRLKRYFKVDLTERWVYSGSMNRITIKVLGDGFSYTSGSGVRKRKDATKIFNWVERKLGCLGRSLASRLEDKTAVRVIYVDGGLNETVSTDEPREILYALAAFLEDYLPKELLAKKYKKYGSA